jgi:accessory gene regulator protein AgrB
MNRTQKESLVILVSGLLTLPMFAYAFCKPFILKETFTGLERFLLLMTALIMVVWTLLGLLVWAPKRQSPREPVDDERDKQIKHKAAMISLISACISLPIVSVIPRLIVGDNGCIPAWSLPFIIFGALLIPGTICWIAILAQYFFRRGDGDK